jgi:hypothetical protein
LWRPTKSKQIGRNRKEVQTTKESGIEDMQIEQT